jgi:hypothetical protein
MKVQKTGDWALARRLLAAGPLKLKAAVGTALRQKAQLLRKESPNRRRAARPSSRSRRSPSRRGR